MLNMHFYAFKLLKIVGIYFEYFGHSYIIRANIIVFLPFYLAITSNIYVEIFTLK